MENYYINLIKKINENVDILESMISSGENIEYIKDHLCEACLLETSNRQMRININAEKLKISEHFKKIEEVISLRFPDDYEEDALTYDPKYKVYYPDYPSKVNFEALIREFNKICNFIKNLNEESTKQDKLKYIYEPKLEIKENLNDVNIQLYSVNSHGEKSLVFDIKKFITLEKKHIITKQDITSANNYRNKKGVDKLYNIYKKELVDTILKVISNYEKSTKESSKLKNILPGKNHNIKKLDQIKDESILNIYYAYHNAYWLGFKTIFLDRPQNIIYITGRFDPDYDFNIEEYLDFVLNS